MLKNSARFTFDTQKTRNTTQNTPTHTNKHQHNTDIIQIRCTDDLEMDYVAALEQQIHRSGADGNVGDVAPTIPPDNANVANASDANFSPKEMRKFDSKKRWKNWGWKYSPGKTSSIEEEPTETTSAKTSRHSSPTSSPKHKKANDSAAAVVSNLLNQSPLRRRPQSGQSSQSMRVNGKPTNAPNSTAAANRSDIRSSAGARLCQTLDNLDDDSNDEFQALIINGRPASVHIVPMSSSQQLQ